MSDPTTEELPSVTWRTRKVRRAAGTLGAAVVLATVGPAIANAAGADVANPIAAALRASGKGIATAFGVDADDSCETPVEQPTATPSEGTDPDGTVSAEPTLDATATPSDVPTDVATEPAEDCDDAETTDETESPSPSPSPEPTETPSEEPAEEGNHGQIVSTVAKCAPKGKDPLLDVDGAPANHGGYVKVAAHGDTLTLPWGTYDLSTLSGAEDLCASLEAARADLADEETEDKGKKGKKDKGAKGRPSWAGQGGKPKK